jgi:uncharacterized protein YegL
MTDDASRRIPATTDQLRQRIAERTQRVAADFGSTTTSRFSDILIALLDVSTNMEGKKLFAAKQGLLAMARDSVASNVSVGLVSFNFEAQALLLPTRDIDAVQRALAQLHAGGGTSLAPTLERAGVWLDRRFGRRSVLVVTDGQVSDADAALSIVARMKADGVRFASIGTYDADRTFLAQLASENALGSQVADRGLGTQIEATARALLSPPKAARATPIGALRRARYGQPTRAALQLAARNSYGLRYGCIARRHGLTRSKALARTQCSQCSAPALSPSRRLFPGENDGRQTQKRRPGIANP